MNKCIESISSKHFDLQKLSLYGFVWYANKNAAANPTISELTVTT
jgi:hypothetical protein